MRPPAGFVRRFGFVVRMRERAAPWIPLTPWDALTSCEQEAAIHAASGASASEIAQKLGITRQLVLSRIGRARKKLGVRNNVGLARLVFREGKAKP